ncbi:DUF1566 domain-containing protein, partial [Thermodesulfobacteriota bacterium]
MKPQSASKWIMLVLFVLALVSPVSAALDTDSDGISDAEEIALGTDPLVANAFVPRTGQTSCYDAAGSIILCTGTGQDGDIQAGVAWPSQRFTDNGDGTTTDNLTGLMWLKNADCLDLAGGIDKSGSLLSWQNALTWSDSISNGLCGLTDNSEVGDWRLPNINELQSLYDSMEDYPPLTSGHPFDNVQQHSHFYWSSSATASNGWITSMGEDYVNASSPVNGNYVWPVKVVQADSIIKLPKTSFDVSYGPNDDGALKIGIEWPSPRLKDNNDGTVVDSLTGLVWLKDANCLDTSGSIVKNAGSLSWPEALIWSNSLKDGVCELTDNSQVGDWRLPNRLELSSLIDRTNTPALPSSHPFTNLMYSSGNYYWASTTSPQFKHYAKHIYFRNGVTGKGIKTQSSFVWPVRDGFDTDSDGIGDNSDAFPTDPAASVDSDGDGSPDSWNEGKTVDDSTTGLTLDALPSDPTEWDDTDADGVGDYSDAFPTDIAASIDTDSDGYPNSWNANKTVADSTTGLTLDAFPSDATENT